MAGPNGNIRREDEDAEEASRRRSFLYLIARIEAGEIQADQWALNHLRYRAGVGPEIIDLSSDSEEEEEDEEEEDDDVVYLGLEGEQQGEQAQEGSANSVCTTLGEQDEVIQPIHIEEKRRKEEKRQKRQRMERMIMESHLGRVPRRHDGEAGPSRAPRQQKSP